MIYLFSDIHLRSETQPWEISFLDTLENCIHKKTTQEIVLLGDILDVCVSHHTQWKTIYPRFFSILQRSHHPILYVEGNHDFHLSAFFKKHTHITVSHTAIETRWGNKRVFLSHGDWIDTRSSYYLKLRHLLRSPFFSKTLQALPFFMIHKSAKHLSRYQHTQALDHLSHHNKLRPLFHKFVEQKWHEGFHCVVLGHIHTFEHMASDQGVYLNCGFWPRDRKYFAIDPDTWKIQAQES